MAWCRIITGVTVLLSNTLKKLEYDKEVKGSLI